LGRREGSARIFSCDVWRIRLAPTERQFGFSPDGGDGSIEVLVVIVLVAIISLGALRLATIPTSVRNEKRTRNYKRSG